MQTVSQYDMPSYISNVLRITIYGIKYLIILLYELSVIMRKYMISY